MDGTGTGVALEPITADEFIEGVLAGERDFSRRIGEGLNLSGHEGFGELRVYLINNYHRSDPISIRESDFQGLVARDIHLPYLNGIKANLKGADFKGARLYGVDFGKAVLHGVDFSLSNLEGSRLYHADLRQANFMKTTLKGADLRGSDLRGARNLEYSINLGQARFKDDGVYGETIVTARERDIILNATALNLDVREE